MVANILNNYLVHSGNTLGFIASKTGIDRSLLSKISNGARNASLDAGIKILRTCRATKEQILEFIDETNRTQSQSYVEVIDEDCKAKVNQDLSMRVARITDLRDAFLDIADMGAEGFPISELEKEYGIQVHEKLKPMTDAGVINKEGVNYIALAEYFHFDQKSSACLAESIVEHGRSEVETDSFVGECFVEVCNLPRQGRMAIRELLMKQKNELLDTIQKYQVPTRKDGKRVGITTMFTNLKGLIVVCLMGSFFSSVDLRAGGISGGASGSEGNGPKAMTEAPFDVADLKLKKSVPMPVPQLSQNIEFPQDITGPQEDSEEPTPNTDDQDTDNLFASILDTIGV